MTKSKTFFILAKSKRFNKISGGNINQDSLTLHIERAEFLVFLGMHLAILIFIMFGEKSSKLPVIGAAMRAFLALCELHRNKDEDFSTNIRGELLVGPCGFVPEKYDEIIVGSGPGGAIAFNVAEKYGKKILLVEKGRMPNANIQQHGVHQMVNQFANGGQQFILGQQIIPFAQGSVLGGGSEINSGLYHKVPASILDEWCKSLAIDVNSWRKSEKFIGSLLQVQKQPDASLGVYLNSPLLDLAQLRGWEIERIPRWRTYNGKNYVHHSATDVTVKEEHVGKQILLGHEVSSFEVKSSGILLKIKGTDCGHDVLTRYLTIAGGTLNSSLLLINSLKLQPRDFDFNFHAMVRIIAKFPKEVNDLLDIDPHQLWDEQLNSKVGAAVGTRDFLNAMMVNMGRTVPSNPQNYLPVYHSSVPRGKGGMIKIGKAVLPVFRLTKEFRNGLTLETHELARDLIKVGATEVIGKISKPMLSTVHIFGSMPLGRTKILDINGFVLNTNNRVRVCDASLLPIAPRVNPQGAVCSLSYLLSERIHEVFW